ncbi:hypothetical protein RIR_jg6087.t1 [Rhizophagus irregularis DAOM 181602=DAOM 197198]|nr:hypothetical protein RIR_jg6087.t1 [Rhizophagus irregularis DAOM 181602=DAOM 197198]
MYVKFTSKSSASSSIYSVARRAAISSASASALSSPSWDSRLPSYSQFHWLKRDHKGTEEVLHQDRNAEWLQQRIAKR